MRYYFDTEFYERIENGKWTIDLISIGVVSERGDELYLENADFDVSTISDEWLQNNVIPQLKGGHFAVPLTTIRFLVESFVDDKPIFWAYFADYDWVLFCTLFGRMCDLPNHFPYYCRDLKQLMDETGVTKRLLPKLEGSKHNALDDARWLKQAHERLIAIKEGSCC
jgi:hypothetical protein